MSHPTLPTPDKLPKTERGKRTFRKLLDAAALEFGAKGYWEAGVTGITSRADVALGSFYTYFESKEELFRALVRDMSRQVRQHLAAELEGVTDRLEAERRGIEAYIRFVRRHKHLYRIIEESQFVAEDAYRDHYRVFTEAYRHALEAAEAKGQIVAGPDEVRAWALIGISVFLGMRFGVWDEDMSPEQVAEGAGALIARGLAAPRAPAGASSPDLLAAQARLRPNATAIEEVGGRTLSYSELEREAGGIAAVLAARGVGAGDRVAIACGSRAAFFSTLFACARIEAILVPINWRLAGPEVARVLADCAPRLLIREDGVGIGTADVPTIGLAELIVAAAEAEPLPARDWRDEAVWSILYTSGSAGEPKGVVQTFAMARVNAANIRDATGLGADDGCLSVLPIFHTAGVNLYALPALFAGARVMLDEFDAARCLDLLGRADVTHFFGVPTLYRAMAALPDFAHTDLRHLRFTGCGGAPMPPELLGPWDARGAILCNGMGMTETGPTAFVMDRDQALSRPRSIGRPQPLIQARLVAEGREVDGAGEGEVEYRGPGVTPGCWSADGVEPAAGADEWLPSGDIARRDADGYYWVVGRKKEMFISGGENVQAAEVEAALEAHPAVAEAAVTPAPDEHWGEVGHAWVVLAGPLQQAEVTLVAHCRERLAGYKVPRRFSFVDALPRSDAGKVLKARLVE